MPSSIIMLPRGAFTLVWRPNLFRWHVTKSSISTRVAFLPEICKIRCSDQIVVITRVVSQLSSAYNELEPTRFGLMNFRAETRLLSNSQKKRRRAKIEPLARLMCRIAGPRRPCQEAAASHTHTIPLLSPGPPSSRSPVTPTSSQPPRPCLPCRRAPSFAPTAPVLHILNCWRFFPTCVICRALCWYLVCSHMTPVILYL